MAADRHTPGTRTPDLPDGAAATRWIGASPRRVEDRRLLTGAGCFVDDITMPGLLHAAFLRSPLAAATVTSIGATDALALPAVHAVFTAPDLAGITGLSAVLDRPEFVSTTMPLLASDVVRHAGEPLAMVLAESRYAAEDGAEAIVVDYEARPAIASLEAALAPDAPRVHEGAAGNILLDVTLYDDDALDGILARADLVVAARCTSSRLAALPLECRVCLAYWDGREERLVLYTSTQVPHIVRTALALCLGLPESRLRVVAPDVGGGFGLKCVVGREEILVAAAALRTRRPVTWSEDRQENLVASFHAREQRYNVQAAFDAEGRLLALAAEILCDTGAYSAFPFTCGVEPLMAATELPGPYRLRHYRARARAVATNKAPTAPYRGVSRPQITLVLERLMDKAAARLGLDAVEIRRRNLIRRHEFPYTGVTGLVYDPGSYLESLEQCASALGHESWAARQAVARRDGRLLGLGFATFSERTGYGTAAFATRKMGLTPGYESAIVRMDPSGGATVLVGTATQGQGHHTTLAQIVADELGLDLAAVVVRQGDTDVVPHGWGTFASRSVVAGGDAAKRSASLLAAKLKRIAAHLLEADPDDLEMGDGRLWVRGSPSRGITIAELARISHLAAQRLPPGEEPGLEARATADPGDGTFSNATHGVEVEIDPATGHIRINRYVVVEDCGVVINPMIVDGQVRGGVAQGVAAALYERLIHDEEGQLLTGSLMDYLVPTAAEIPSVEIQHLETPSAFSATGAKGMGEGGTIGAPAAIANAVANALAHYGIEFDALPITPRQVRAALRASVAQRGGQT